MGIFDKAFTEAPKGDEKFTQQEAFAGIALAVAGADGFVDSQEWDTIVTYIRRLRIYDNFSQPAFDKLFDKLFAKLKSEGPSSLVAAAKAGLSDDIKLTAFACAVDIALADGILKDEEKDIISQLAGALKVDEKLAVSIIEVMMIKNKF